TRWLEAQLQRGASAAPVHGGKRRGYSWRGLGRILRTAAIHPALSSASRRPGELAARWRHGAAAPEIRQLLAVACRRGATEPGRDDLPRRSGTAARGADRADRLCRRRTAGEMGAKQGGARRLTPLCPAD